MLTYFSVDLYVVYHEATQRISLCLLNSPAPGFGDKIQKKVITSDMMRVMSEVFQRICKAKKSVMLEFDGESDHCHLLIDLHPDNNISQLVASLKSSSSRILRKQFSDEINKVYWKPVFWSGSYYVSSSGGVTIERLRKYIEKQQRLEPHVSPD